MGYQATRKNTYHSCLLKGFIINGQPHSTSWKKAIEGLNNGEEVYMAVHVKGYGSWRTSRIVNISSSRGGKYVETQGHFYQMIGNEPVKRIKEAKFVNSEGKKPLSTKNKEDVIKIRDMILNSGNKIRAQVIFKDGATNYTSEVEEFYPRSRIMVTHSQSVYRW